MDILHKNAVSKISEIKTFRDVKRQFKTEQYCWEYLENKQWNGRPYCPYCGCEIIYKHIENHRVDCCNKKTCGKQFDVLTGTIYDLSLCSLTKWMQVVYLYLKYKRDLTTDLLSKIVGVDLATSEVILKRMTEANMPFWFYGKKFDKNIYSLKVLLLKFKYA